VDILEYIPFRGDSPISRKELEKRTGFSDRTNRIFIGKERRSETINPVGVILSSSHGRGYWISDYEPEIKEFNRELVSRMKELQEILIHNEQFLLLKSRVERR